MKARVITAAALACLCVTVAWIAQFRYGIGSCGPASDTPVLCLVFGMGPSFLLGAIPPIGRMFDVLPNRVALGIMLVLPAVVWFTVFFAMLALGGSIRKRLMPRGGS
jgi:hypothetical protein